VSVRGGINNASVVVH